jgi:hypothetical protein
VHLPVLSCENCVKCLTLINNIRGITIRLEFSISLIVAHKQTNTIKHRLTVVMITSPCFKDRTCFMLILSVFGFSYGTWVRIRLLAFFCFLFHFYHGNTQNMSKNNRKLMGYPFSNSHNLLVLFIAAIPKKAQNQFSKIISLIRSEQFIHLKFLTRCIGDNIFPVD